MTNNARALQLKAGGEEFDAKRNDLKRLIGRLEKICTEARRSSTVKAFFRARVALDFVNVNNLNLLGVEMECADRSHGIEAKVTFTLKTTRLEKESDLTLAIVRLAWDNMDGIIQAAEMYCRFFRCEDELQKELERFLA